MVYGGDGGGSSARKVVETALKEAANSGIQGVEELITLISKNQELFNRDVSIKTAAPSGSAESAMDFQTVTDKTVNSFKEVISLLDRPRIGHARFRRAPVLHPKQDSEQASKKIQEPETGSPPFQVIKDQVSVFKPFCSTPSYRLPPLPHNRPQNKRSPPLIAKIGVLERNESPSTINFSSSRTLSAGNSFISSSTGNTDSFQPSGFQLTSPSHVPSSGKPPLFSSLKRKCNSLDCAALKYGSFSRRCHCSKKRLVS